MSLDDPNKAFLTGGGEMGALMCEHDWSTSQVGSPEDWPECLRSAVSLILPNKHFMLVAWGPELDLLYNDAYRPVFGRKHPWALGRPFREVWSEVWEEVKPLVDIALGGEATWSENLYLVLERNGYPEDCWFTFSFSPLRDETNAVVGLLCAASETTDTVLAERYQAFRLELAERLRDLVEPVAVMNAAVALLGKRLGANRVGYGEVQTDDLTAVLHGSYVDGVTPLTGAMPLDSFGPAMIARLRQGITQYSNDLNDDPDQDPTVWAAIDTRAFVSVPYVRHGRLAATLYVNVRKLRVWTSNEIALIEETAARIWSAVERARADAALRESEERYRQIIESADDFAIITLDPNGLITTWNTGAQRLLGYSELEALGQSGDIFFTPEDRAAGVPDRENSRALDSGRAVNERWHLRRDGSRFWGSGLMMRLDHNSGGFLKMFRDRTAEHEAEQALHESEARLRELNETLEERVAERTAERDRLWRNSQDMLVITAMDGTYLAVNKAFCDITGREEHELVGLNYVGLVHPDDLAAAANILSDISETPLTKPFEHRLLHQNGEYRWTSWTAACEDGRIYGNGRDVTDERAQAAELALRTTERNRVWSTSRGLLVIADLHGVFRAVNPAWTLTLGYTEAETIGRGYSDFIVEDDVYPTSKALTTAASGLDVDGFQNSYRHQDGSIRCIAWNTSVEGDLIYAFGRDVTEERAREAEMQALEEQLRQAQKMEAIGLLTGGVAHDFNNLLSPIVGSLDMLVRRGVGNDRERRLIDGALQSAERATVLVQRLLAFARRQPLQLVAVEIARLVEGMAGLLSSTLGATIDVSIEIDADLPPANADPNQLEMALLNLAVNARDAMPGGGKLTIKAKRSSGRPGEAPGLLEGHYILLSVEDTGTGMDELTRLRAIEPFFSTKGIGKGTGLGLSMVHGLAAQLGGGLTIDSALDNGTRIELWLPVSDTAIGVEEAIGAAPAARAARGLALVVDDESLVRMSTADMLLDLGFEVVEAESAEEALQHLKTGPMPNLLVTDHLMPGMNGTELAREARDIYPGIPILITSGYARLDGIPNDLSLLTKPFRNADLEASISALIPFDG